jgi:glycosyltransferase involved in cell wall biosynthesis
MRTISIIICTCNRAESLRATLDSLKNIQIPGDQLVELIVADNGSEDHTSSVINAAELRHIIVRQIRLPQKHKSLALNAALGVAKGEIFAFIDDDVRPSRSWLVDLCAPILCDLFDAVQGTILLPESLQRPWMERVHKGMYASSDAFSSNPAGHLIGANMAFSRSVLAVVPTYDLELGPGTTQGSGEDTLFRRQIVQAGLRVGRAPEAVVEHHFDPSRLSRNYLLGYARRIGRSEAYIAHHWEHREMKHLRLSLCLVALRLTRRRAIHVDNWRRKEGAQAWELDGVRNCAFLRHYLQLAGTPRNYTKHGLVRVR